MRILTLFVALFSLLGVPMQTAAQSNALLDIKEWEVPWRGSRPRDPFVESGDSVWFVGQVGDYLAHLTPSTGAMTRVDLEPGTGPHNLIVGEDGKIWFAGNRRGYIGVFDPITQSIEKINMPDRRAGDPHTLIFGQTGDIWFTVQQGNFVGRLDPQSRSVTLISVPTRNALPYGIADAPDGTIWVALLGTSKLASVDPATGVLIEHQLPRTDARPRRVSVTSDGRVWYVDFVGGQLGVLNPTTGIIKEWVLPAGRRARPYGMEVDSQDRIWLVQTGPRPNIFIGFDPARERFINATPIPSGAGSVRHMNYHAPTGSVWFGTDANTVGRAKVE